MSRLGPGKSHDGTGNLNPAGIGFWHLVAEDFQTNGNTVGSQGFWAIFWHRFGNWRMSIKVRALRLPFSLIYILMSKAVEILCGISIPYTVILGRRVRLEHFGGMILVADRIGDDVTIRQNTTLGIAKTSEPEMRPIIGDRVDIGAGAVIIGNVTIGNDCTIGANAVVIKSVPPGKTAVGVPAKELET